MRRTDSFNVTPEILNQMLNFYNLSRQKFIQTYKLQPLVYIPELPFAAKVTFVVVYCAIFLLAFCGNTLVLCIVKRGKRSRTVTTIFICSLAVSDLLITFFCIPFTLLQNISSQWVGGTFVCKMVPFVQTTAVVSCVLTMTCIAVERYEGIVHPLRRHYLNTRACKMLGFAWAVAVIVGSPMLYVQQLEVKYDFLYERRYVSCLECWNSASLRKAYAVFILVALFLLPQLVMLLLYSRIAFELWIKKRVGDNSFLTALNQREMSKIAKKKKRAVVIMITVVVLFTICWAPFHVVYILFEFNKLDEIYDDVTVNMIIAVVQAIGFFNSFNNPIIYTFMNETFKNDCFSFLSCCAHRRHQKATARVQNPNTAARLAAWVEDPPQMRKHMKPENNNQIEHVELNWCVNYKLATREPAQLPMLPCATQQDLPCTSGHG
ncbi:pyroglutamylated RF-amide peptide receptor-like [Chiloscyllium plagiosum]|uniref:pyroglutamylated RF-amide peptide receptor-like n=1 Tax=Chiloscyllium plagiosum TaxID=36176 RepID=UPI001CB87C16|nr:pyroglutamylated RF-amide peptide receptor-like [Chiloscyllium plagiosum]XP_043534531.1 pyroglutamylated RF-amide peptide receptor-like [Chiloscyllium plagiosum]